MEQHQEQPAPPTVISVNDAQWWESAGYLLLDEDWEKTDVEKLSTKAAAVAAAAPAKVTSSSCPIVSAFDAANSSSDLSASETMKSIGHFHRTTNGSSPTAAAAATARPPPSFDQKGKGRKRDGRGEEVLQCKKKKQSQTKRLPKRTTAAAASGMQKKRQQKQQQQQHQSTFSNNSTNGIAKKGRKRRRVRHIPRTSSSLARISREDSNYAGTAVTRAPRGTSTATAGTTHNNPSNTTREMDKLLMAALMGDMSGIGVHLTAVTTSGDVIQYISEGMRTALSQIPLAASTGETTRFIMHTRDTLTSHFSNRPKMPAALEKRIRTNTIRQQESNGTPMDNPEIDLVDEEDEYPQTSNKQMMFAIRKAAPRQGGASIAAAWLASSSCDTDGGGGSGRGGGGVCGGDRMLLNAAYGRGGGGGYQGGNYLYHSMCQDGDRYDEDDGCLSNHYHNDND